MRLKAVIAVFAVLFSAPLCKADSTGEREPELRARLAQAMQGDGFDDRYSAEVWLADMSLRLRRYAPKSFTDEKRGLEFLRLLHAEAAKAKLSPELVLALIDAGSGFDRLSISQSGRIGYMQVPPGWLQEVGKDGDNLFQATTNLRIGCTMLRYYLDQEHGSYVRALVNYQGNDGKPEYPSKVLNLLNARWSPERTQPTNADSEGAPNEGEMKVSIKQLTDDYEANELAADRKYNTSRHLVVRGRINRIAKSLGSPFVELADGQGNSIHAWLQDQQTNKAERLMKGSSVTVECAKAFDAIGANLSDCIIKDGLP